MAPEILHQEPQYNGTAADLWSIMLILYQMMHPTAQRLFRLPIAAADAAYKLFCCHPWHGLARPHATLRAVQQQLLTSQKSRSRQEQRLLQSLQHVARMSPALRTLLAHSLLAHDPAKRWTLPQVLDCDFVRHGPAVVTTTTTTTTNTTIATKLSPTTEADTTSTIVNNNNSNNNNNNTTTTTRSATA